MRIGTRESVPHKHLLRVPRMPEPRKGLFLVKPRFRIFYPQDRPSSSRNRAGSVAEVFATKPRAWAKCTSSQSWIRVKSSPGWSLWRDSPKPAPRRSGYTSPTTCSPPGWDSMNRAKPGRRLVRQRLGARQKQHLERPLRRFDFPELPHFADEIQPLAQVFQIIQQVRADPAHHLPQRLAGLQLPTPPRSGGAA